MNQPTFGQKTASATGPGAGAADTPAAGAGQPTGKAAAGSNGSEAVLGPFTIRDLAVFAATLVLFVASLLPVFGGRYNLWNLNNLFFLGLGILLPLVVSALFAARRLVPATKLRIGSLSVDQFASVVASFAVAFFFLSVAGAFNTSLLVGLIGAVVLFAVTVLGRYLPFISRDFQGRVEVPAHVVAREAAVPVQKPRAVKDTGAGVASAAKSMLGGLPFGTSGAAADRSHAPATAAGAPESGSTAPGAAPAEPAPSPAAYTAPVHTPQEAPEADAFGDDGPPTQAADVVRQHNGLDDERGAGAGPAWEPPAATAVHQQIHVQEPIGATVDPASRAGEEDSVPEAFWFAVAQHRTAYDPQTGAPAFVIEPGGWVLALEDRGHEFLVQHTDGRLGVLRDLSNIERG